MNTLKEIENQVKLLIEEEKWAEAYHICNDILRKDPENITFAKLSIQIEKLVKKSNVKAIKDEIKNLEPLLKEKKFQEYLQKISHLQNYQTDYPEIGNIILHAKRLMDNYYNEKKQQVFKEEIKFINQNQGNLKYPEIIQRLEQLLKLDINLEKTQNLIKKYKELWVNDELEKNRGLLNSQRFEEIIVFLIKLKKIAPGNQHIKRWMTETENNYQQYKIDNKKDYIFKTIENIKSFYITKNYEKVMILCESILEIDPKNQLSRTYYKNALQKANFISSKKIELDIYEKYSEYTQLRKTKPENFIKI